MRLLLLLMMMMTFLFAIKFLLRSVYLVSHTARQPKLVKHVLSSNQYVAVASSPERQQVAGPIKYLFHMACNHCTS